ncbi:MAG: hypothetical protein ACRYG5_01640 [Janthinobacterium lividum]
MRTWLALLGAPSLVLAACMGALSVLSLLAMWIPQWLLSPCR